MVVSIGGGKYRFKNGAIAIKKPTGQYRIVSGASKQYMKKIHKKKVHKRT